MLQTPDQMVSDSPAPVYEAPMEDTGGISIGELIGVLRRAFWMIVFLTSCTLALAMFYIKSTLPTYSTSTSLLIDPRELTVLPDEDKIAPNLLKENLVIDSQIEIVKTNDLLRRVMDKLDIMNDPDFMDIGLMDRLSRNIPNSRGEYTDRDMRSVLGKFKKKISTRRKGLTHVFMISYSSIDPERAAEVLNTLSEEYIAYQLETKIKQAEEANAFLESRLDQLRAKVVSTDQAVEDFKVANNLGDADGAGIIEREVSELNKQLVGVKAYAAEAKAKYDRIKAFLNGQSDEITVKEVLSNIVIIELRRSYAKAQRKIQQLGSNYGDDHEAVRRAKDELAQTNELIRQEVQRIAQSYYSDFEITQERVKIVEANLAAARQKSDKLSPEFVQLQELERQAEAAKAIYTSVLTRYNETLELKALPSSNIRVIETAEIPNNPGSPAKGMILALAIIFGAGGGFGLALLRYIIDNRVWTKADLELATRRGCLGIIPELPGKFLKPRDSDRAMPLSQTFLNLDGRKHNHSSTIQLSALRPFHRIIAQKNDSMAEVFRNARLAMRLKDEYQRNMHKGKGKVIMFASTEQGEGKSFLSIVNALHMANSGARTLLIDADFHRCELTRALTPLAPFGIEELVQTRKIKLSEVITHDAATQLRFLPARNLARQPSNIDIVVTGVFNEFINKIRDYFDYIIIDVPPILAMPDGRGLAAIVDHVIYIGDWGRIEKSSIKRALEHAPELSEKVTGCVVNRVNVKKFAKYGESALIGYPDERKQNKSIPARLRKKLTMLHMLVDKNYKSFMYSRRH